MEFVYWKHPTLAGVTVEEISGADDKSPAVWRAMSRQIFGENGKDTFRVISHLDSGAPILGDGAQRISVSDTPHFLCVASLPRTPEADLTTFSPRTAMGIDCEKCDREQVLKVRDRVMSEAELAMVDADDLQSNVLMWTCKEALYKAAFNQGADFRIALQVKTLPELCAGPMEAAAASPFGEAVVRLADGSEAPMQLFSYLSEGHIISIAFSPKCAKFKR